MLNILPISDVHGNQQVLDYILGEIDPDSYDIITCSGDIWEGSSTGEACYWDDFQKAVGKPIVMIQGNHDFWSSSVFDSFEHIELLHNDCYEFNGVKFFGTPYTVNFGMWNNMCDENSLFEVWDKAIPDDLDVLLTHGPPYGYGDNCNQPIYNNDKYSHLGSKALNAIILERNPKYVFCGHIHSGDRYSVMDNGTKVYNVSCLDEAYMFGGFNPYPKVVSV